MVVAGAEDVVDEDDVEPDEDEGRTVVCDSDEVVVLAADTDRGDVGVAEDAKDTVRVALGFCPGNVSC